jgi:16S rRNA (uracil1498-N3)-methyltransferase
MLELASSADLALFCYELEEKTMLKYALREPSRKPQVILLMVGPEGGFTEKEADDARAAGCRPVSLGRRILRTETAALVGLAGILYEFGEMGG